MRIGICDDVAADRQVVKRWLITNISKMKNEDIVEFQSGWALLDYMAHDVLDIVCLDCRMDGLDGIETARAILSNTGDTVVILISSYHRYAARGYGLNIFRYVLKAEFNQQAEDIFPQAIIHSREYAEKTYWIKEQDKQKRINVAKITYVESARNRLTFHMRDGRQLYQYKLLSGIEEEFNRYGFIRCHQSYLVNSRYVCEIARYNILLYNGQIIPVSQERYTPTFKALALRETEGL